MSAVRLSPTANLLRKSRLFSLPSAIPPPQAPPTSQFARESDTATLPYPTHAAIQTPSSSLARGDWGLKRPLPSKSTSGSSSEPIVRVRKHDAMEHYTDFESALDHVLTLRKWQELFLPVSLLPSSSGSRLTPKHVSVFESKNDNTEESVGATAPQNARYRFKGPWLAGQTEQDFEKYLKAVRKQKPELVSRIREHLEARRTTERRRDAMDNGKDLTGLETTVKVSDDEFITYLKSLRASPSQLGQLIYELLDLAPSPSQPADAMGQRHFDASPSNVSTVGYAQNGPPKTHPSAGLSYLRTMAQIDNHPVMGPQQHQKPVQARILRSKKNVRGNALRAVAGVGGIVAEDLKQNTFKEENAPEGIMTFNPDIPGGAKYWVRPTRTYVDSAGRIKMTTERATENVKAIHGIVEKKNPLPDYIRGLDRTVSRLDRPQASSAKTDVDAEMGKLEDTHDIAKFLQSTMESKKA